MKIVENQKKSIKVYKAPSSILKRANKQKKVADTSVKFKSGEGQISGGFTYVQYAAPLRKKSPKTYIPVGIKPYSTKP